MIDFVFLALTLFTVHESDLELRLDFVLPVCFDVYLPVAELLADAALLGVRMSSIIPLSVGHLGPFGTILLQCE